MNWEMNIQAVSVGGIGTMETTMVEVKKGSEV